MIEENHERVADSLQAAAGMSNYTVSQLKLLKKEGCPGFKGSRVYLDEIDEFVSANDFDFEFGKLKELDEIKIETARAKLERIRFDNEVAMGGFAKIDDVVELIMGIMQKQKMTLRQKLEDELPAHLQGKRQDDIRAKMRETVDAICNESQREAEDWIKEQSKS